MWESFYKLTNKLTQILCQAETIITRVLNFTKTEHFCQNDNILKETTNMTEKIMTPNFEVCLVTA